MTKTVEKLQKILREAVARINPFMLFIMCTGIALAAAVGINVTGKIHAPSQWAGAMLACTSVIVVLQKTSYRDSLSMGLMRVFGTFVGALVSFIYLKCFDFSFVGMLAAVFVLEMLFMMLNIYNNGHIATITMITILMVSQTSLHNDPMTNCLLRFCESAVGVGIGVGLLWIIDIWNRAKAALRRLKMKKRTSL